MPSEWEEPTQFPTSEALLDCIKGMSDDITKVVVTTTDVMFTKPGHPPVMGKNLGMMIYRLASRTILISKEDAELLLNDGLLNRMRIPIELMREQSDATGG